MNLSAGWRDAATKFCGEPLGWGLKKTLWDQKNQGQMY